MPPDQGKLPSCHHQSGRKEGQQSHAPGFPVRQFPAGSSKGTPTGKVASRAVHLQVAYLVLPQAVGALLPPWFCSPAGTLRGTSNRPVGRCPSEYDRPPPELVATTPVPCLGV